MAFAFAFLFALAALALWFELVERTPAVLALPLSLVSTAVLDGTLLPLAFLGRFALVSTTPVLVALLLLAAALLLALAFLFALLFALLSLLQPIMSAATASIDTKANLLSISSPCPLSGLQMFSQESRLRLSALS